MSVKKHILKNFYTLIIPIFFTIQAFGQNKNGEIHTAEAFEYSYLKIISAKVTGNKRTKNRIITRELDFKLGDSLATFNTNNKFSISTDKRINKSDSSELIKRLGYSRENIIDSKLFLTVDIHLEQISGNEYNLLIDVQERWYLWAFPVARVDAPNFNDWLQDPNLDLLNMGVFASHNNMFGLSHQTSIITYFGNSQLYGLGYYIPWIGQGQKIGLRLGVVYSNSGAVEYASVENERQMLYDKNSLKKWLVGATLNMRPGLYNYGKIRLQATTASVSDSLLVIAPNYLPDGKKDVSNMNLYADYVYDTRNNKSYPLKGNLLRGFIDKRGMGILSRDVDYFYYGVDFHFYQSLGNGFYVAEMVKAVNSSSENIAYNYKQNLTSGDDFIRGYDYFALRGDQMYFFRSNVKYELVPPQVKVPKDGNEESKFKNLQYAFYLNFFADAAYMKDDFTADNPLNNKALFSWGLGLDFVSYYDLVLRFEYAFTSVGTNGFYFGFGIPI